jgi:pseudouridine-5'-phosphate glycosidase
MTPLLAVSGEVAAALAANRPVVALETTIVSHGMPWPQNIETALAVEAIVRDGGAIPAAIAVMDGRVRVGLDRAALERLAKSGDVLKLSRADLAYAVAAGKAGATTVAATMIVAKLAGIGVFATGGIGGVHKGAETSFDISADLTELARTDVTVVAAGAKALLDIPKTLELLETLGVPVVAYGSDDFPAFWSRSSGIPAPIRLDDPAAIAAFLGARSALGLRGGVLVANPVPAADEIPAAEMAAHIDAADQAARAARITGKAVTPFLLDAILKSTAGRSLTTNIALIKNNAKLAAEIAVAIAKARGEPATDL